MPPFCTCRVPERLVDDRLVLVNVTPKPCTHREPVATVAHATTLAQLPTIRHAFPAQPNRAAGTRQQCFLENFTHTIDGPIACTPLAVSSMLHPGATFNQQRKTGKREQETTAARWADAQAGRDEIPRQLTLTEPCSMKDKAHQMACKQGATIMKLWFWRKTALVDVAFA
jgi:hypothetical protein